MSNTNTAPNTQDSLQVIFRLLDEVDHFLESLVENKPIEWTNCTTGIKHIATTRETLADLQDKALFLRVEAETLQEKLNHIKTITREMAALLGEVEPINHERKIDSFTLPVVDLHKSN